jgi:hypothetical protein
MNMYVCLVIVDDAATNEALAYSEVVIAESEQDALEKAKVKIAADEFVSDVRGFSVEQSVAKKIDRALLEQAATTVLGWLPDNEDSMRDEAGGMMSRHGKPGDAL